MDSDDITLDLQIDEIATDFEAKWGGTAPVSIEVCLAKHPDLPRPVLLRTLMLSELELARREYLHVDLELYLKRFPNDQQIVRDVFGCDESDGSQFESEKLSDNDLQAVDLAETIRPSDVPTKLDLSDPSSHQFPSEHRTIGEYQLAGLIGSGGMGAVHKAWHQRLKRMVALKVIHFGQAESQSARQRFENEAKAIASIQHPNVVTIYENNAEGDVCFIAMELVAGTSLETSIANQRRDRKGLLRIVASVADGLTASHEKRVAHRDIKPANILVRGDGQPVIVDFGLARFLDASHLTRTGAQLGTPAYMAPEQISDPMNVGELADIHAIGLILYEITTGGKPFSGDSFEQIKSRIVRDVPQSPRSKDRGISRDLDTIVMKCLEKEPRNRYLSAAEVAADLRHYLAGETIVARPVPWPIRAARWTRRYPQAAAILIMASILLLSLLTITAQSWRTAKMATDLRLEATARQQESEQATAIEKQLRVEAETARRDAEDASRFAETQQLRATCQASQYALDAGRTNEANDLISTVNEQIPHATSIETQWMKGLSRIELVPQSHFSTSDWGLYDSAVSPDQKKLASVDRTGRVEVCEIATGKLVVRLRDGAIRDTNGCPLPRVVFEVGKYQGHSPDQFPSSIAWESDDSLLLAFLDGQLMRIDLNKNALATEIEMDEVMKSTRPLHFVRVNTDNEILAADEGGGLHLLDRSGKELAQSDTGTMVDLLRFSSAINGWIVAGRDGKLRLLDRELKLLVERDCGSRIHDCRTTANDPESLLIAAGEEPIQQFRISRKSEMLELVAAREYQIPDRPNQLKLLQTANIGTQLLALDNQGKVHVWQDAQYQLAVKIGMAVEIRLPDSSEDPRISAFESRNGVSLEVLPDGWLQLSKIGTAKVFAADSFVKRNPWKMLTTQVGKFPQLQQDPHHPGNFWALSRDGQLSYMDSFNDRVEATIEEAHAGGREGIAVLNNGDVVTVGNDRFVKFWRMSDGAIRELRRIEGPDLLLSVAVHEEKSLVAAVDVNARLHLFELKTGKLLHSLDILSPELKSKGSDEASTVEDPSLPILTGRVAFSKSGEYVGAFGAYQSFAVFETKNYARQSLTDIRIAGDGGTAICFSPVNERRFLHSSMPCTSPNAVVSLDPNEDRRFSLSYSGTDCVDMKPTADGKRIVGLFANDEIHFVAGEHLQQIHHINSPMRNAHAIAIGSSDASLLVADRDGKLAWGTTTDGDDAVESEGVVDGTVHWPKVEQPFPAILPGTGNPEIQVVDRNGHLATSLICGSLGEQARDKRFCLLRKREGVWRLEPVRFEGENFGPCLSAHLAMAPNGQMVAVIRQGIPDQNYNGRVLLAYEPENDRPWPTEVVLDSGNMGHTPQVFFGDDQQVEEILHFDYEWTVLNLSTRPSVPGNWPMKSLKTFAGYGTSMARSQNRRSHLLISPQHGKGTDAPSLYATRTPGITGSLEFDKHSNTPGRILLLSSTERVFAWNHLSGEIFERIDDGEWMQLTRLNDPKFYGSLPWIDAHDRIWICACTGKQIECRWFDLERWHSLKIQLDQTLPLGTICSCRINVENRLEIFVGRWGVDARPAMVETVLPVAKGE